MENQKIDSGIQARFLQGRIVILEAEVRGLRQTLQGVQENADKYYKMFVAARDRLDVLRSEAETVLKDAGVWELHQNLTNEIDALVQKSVRLRGMRDQWRELAVKAVRNKTRAAEEARDLEAALQQMRKHAEALKQQRDDLEKSAEKTVDSLDAKLKRIQEQCELWNRGELDIMTAMAGITGEMRGFPLPEPGSWERAKAVRAAEILSQNREMAIQLGDIEDLLTEEGVTLETTHVDMVRVYIDRVRGE